MLLSVKYFSIQSTILRAATGGQLAEVFEPEIYQQLL
jgi:hypothetical protein